MRSTRGRLRNQGTQANRDLHTHCSPAVVGLMVAPSHRTCHTSATPDVSPSSWALRIVGRAMRTRLHDRSGTCAVWGEDTPCAPLARACAPGLRRLTRRAAQVSMSGCARDTDPAAWASAGSRFLMAGCVVTPRLVRGYARCRQAPLGLTVKRRGGVGHRMWISVMIRDPGVNDDRQFSLIINLAAVSGGRVR